MIRFADTHLAVVAIATSPLVSARLLEAETKAEEARVAATRVRAQADAARGSA